MPHLGSVTPDFQVVRIAFTHVIQFMLLPSREVGKKWYYYAILTKSRVQCSEREGDFLRVPRGKRFYNRVSTSAMLELYLFIPWFGSTPRLCDVSLQTPTAISLFLSSAMSCLFTIPISPAFIEPLPHDGWHLRLGEEGEAEKQKAGRRDPNGN